MFALTDTGVSSVSLSRRQAGTLSSLFPFEPFALANKQTHKHGDGGVISEPLVETHRHCTNTGPLR